MRPLIALVFLCLALRSNAALGAMDPNWHALPPPPGGATTKEPCSESRGRANTDMFPSLSELGREIVGNDAIFRFRLVRFETDPSLPDNAQRGLLYFRLDDAPAMYTDLSPNASWRFELALHGLAKGRHQFVAAVVTRGHMEEDMQTYWLDCFVIE
jgi:hypothetical protein